MDLLHKLHIKLILQFLTQGLEHNKHNLSYNHNQVRYNKEGQVQFIVVQVNHKLQLNNQHRVKSSNVNQVKKNNGFLHQIIIVLD